MFNKIFKLHIYANILILLLSISIAAAIQNDEREQWICTSADYCIKNTKPNIRATIYFESQQDCRLSCGKYGAIWPMPTGTVHISNSRELIDPANRHIDLVAPNDVTKQFVREAVTIFLKNIRKECIKNCTVRHSKIIVVRISVNSSSIALDWDTDESYSLAISTNGTAANIEIRATTIYGARHGLETWSNLITASKGNGLLMVSNAHITDKPVYPHRGLLLDTSRNFIPMRIIKSSIDAMAASKMNVFHWHVVDSHSFPLEITRVPQMQKFGAYGPKQIYTREDTQHIIKYAWLRGIRVLIEIDGPAHAGNGWQWGPAAGLGNMSVCINQSPWQMYCGQPPCGQLNPVNDNMYATLKEIYTDIAEIVAPEETIHMGGDEVFIPCWNSTPEITSHMLDTGYDLSLKSFLKLWSQFHLKNLNSFDDITRQHFPNISEPKSTIVWSSQLTEPAYIEEMLPNERFIIQTWVDSSDPLNSELLRKGYRLIVSTLNAWYLDHGNAGSTRSYNWRQVYENRLPENAKLVLGGETCMWSEYVDESAVEPRIWPRTGAAAERLWSNPTTSAASVQPRFYRYRERLIARGIKPDAVFPKWCVLNEGQCY